MMEAKFKNWLLSRGNQGAANSYPKAINLLSGHYSKTTGTPIDIYTIRDQTKISEIAHDFSQSGKFSEFGYEQHGRSGQQLADTLISLFNRSEKVKK